MMAKKKVKSDKASNKVLYVAIAFIIAIFALAYLFFQGKPAEPEAFQDVVEYNGYTFSKAEGIWYSTVDVDWLGKRIKYSLMTFHSPLETENVTSDRNAGVVLKLGTSNTAYISVQPDLDSKAVLAGTEISKVLGKMFFMSVKGALTEDDGSDSPVITCENMSESVRVVEIRYAPETAVRRTPEGCVIVEGPTGDEQIRAADRLVFNLLGIDKKVLATG